MIYMSSIIFDTDLSIIHFRYPIHFYNQKDYGVVTQKNYKITKNKNRTSTVRCCRFLFFIYCIYIVFTFHALRIYLLRYLEYELLKLLLILYPGNLCANLCKLLLECLIASLDIVDIINHCDALCCKTCYNQCSSCS